MKAIVSQIVPRSARIFTLQVENKSDHKAVCHYRNSCLVKMISADDRMNGKRITLISLIVSELSSVRVVCTEYRLHNVHLYCLTVMPLI